MVARSCRHIFSWKTLSSATSSMNFRSDIAPSCPKPGRGNSEPNTFRCAPSAVQSFRTYLKVAVMWVLLHPSSMIQIFWRTLEGRRHTSGSKHHRPTLMDPPCVLRLSNMLCFSPLPSNCFLSLLSILMASAETLWRGRTGRRFSATSSVSSSWAVSPLVQRLSGQKNLKSTAKTQTWHWILNITNLVFKKMSNESSSSSSSSDSSLALVDLQNEGILQKTSDPMALFAMIDKKW